MESIKCVGCNGLFPDIDGPIHRYMKSSSGCWAAFGEVLVREYSDPNYYPVHRLTVDAYAVQHPGTQSRQNINSVGAHLIRLCLFIEKGLLEEHANDAMLKATRNKQIFQWLEPPTSLGSLTVADILKTKTAVEHTKAVREWANEAWDAWSPYHDTIRMWIGS